jgi:hypothetical protein
MEDARANATFDGAANCQYILGSDEEKIRRRRRLGNRASTAR